MNRHAGNENTEQRVRIEPLTEAGVEAVAALAREVWLAHYPDIIGVAQIEYMLAQRYDPRILREELRRDGVWWDTLAVAGRLAGFSSYCLAEAPAEMKLDKLYVHPDRQRRGYGGLLIGRACAIARERGCRILALAVNKRNAPAIAAYRKHGFAVREAIVKDIGGGFAMDDYIMEKRL